METELTGDERMRTLRPGNVTLFLIIYIYFFILVQLFNCFFLMHFPAMTDSWKSWKIWFGSDFSLLCSLSLLIFLSLSLSQITLPACLSPSLPPSLSPSPTQSLSFSPFHYFPQSVFQTMLPPQRGTSPASEFFLMEFQKFRIFRMYFVIR